MLDRVFHFRFLHPSLCQLLFTLRKCKLELGIALRSPPAACRFLVFFIPYLPSANLCALNFLAYAKITAYSIAPTHLSSYQNYTSCFPVPRRQPSCRQNGRSRSQKEEERRRTGRLSSEARELYRDPRASWSVTHLYIKMCNCLYAFYAVEKLEDALTSTQEGRRMALDEAARLRQENERLVNALENLRHETREREKYLRTLWHARKGSNDPHIDDFPPPPPSFGQMHLSGTSSSGLGTPVTTPTATAYPPPYNAPPTESLDPRLPYPHHNESPVSLSSNTYHDGHDSVHGDRSPSLPFVSHDSDALANSGRQLDPRRMPKLDQYTNFNVRDTGWQGGVHPSAQPGAEPLPHENNSASHSPAFIPSPSLTSNELNYAPRYPGMEGAKGQLPAIDTVPYLFPTNNNRSISPTVSSPHTAPNSNMAAQFPFGFPPEVHDRSAEYHRRHTNPAPIPEMTLHGGTADVSQVAAFHMRRRISTGPERPMLGAIPSYKESEDISMAESSQAGAEEAHSPRRSRRTATSVEPHPSRSPSPDSKPLSSTLAVLKAHAFGALRRSRTRSGKGKASENAAKVAMQVLESRGIDFSVVRPKKRPRSDDDETYQP